MLWGNNSNPDVQSYLKEEEGVEQKLLPYDLLGTAAHVKMLEDQNYLEEKELEQILEELEKLYDKQPEVIGEDVHTFIEEEVTAQTEAGKKIHTGRSRNDQVVTATRLLMKDSAIDIARETLELIEELEKFAEENNMLIPGYTHQQQAMPSSTGLWASSYSDALVDDLKFLQGVYKTIDSNPLGAAAGYGTELKIDREKTTKLLGFSQKQYNPIYCVNRGKPELMLLQALNHVMLDIQKISEDLINFSEDQKIFEIPEKFCTGSSIMPQKQNPDTLEIARAKAEEVASHQEAVRSIIAKLPHGYNRDTQQTKKHLIKSIETTSETLEIFKELISELEVSDSFKLKENIYAADTANKLVEKGKPFREAYFQVKEEQNYEKDNSIKRALNQPHKTQQRFWKEEEKKFEERRSQLLK